MVNQEAGDAESDVTTAAAADYDDDDDGGGSGSGGCCSSLEPDLPRSARASESCIHNSQQTLLYH